MPGKNGTNLTKHILPGNSMESESDQASRLSALESSSSTSPPNTLIDIGIQQRLWSVHTIRAIQHTTYILADIADSYMVDRSNRNWQSRKNERKIYAFFSASKNNRNFLGSLFSFHSHSHSHFPFVASHRKNMFKQKKRVSFLSAKLTDLLID